MAFCGKCGAPVDGGRFCPRCGTPVEWGQSQAPVEWGQPQAPFVAYSRPAQKSGLWKKIVLGVAVAVAAVLILIIVLRLTGFASTVDEPCDWCGDSPSIAYEMSDGSHSYVCKDCSDECAWCGDKATRHYENLFGMMVFICDDCYEEISGG